ncbi:uncharacterized protein LOC111791698 [Cucurbita pepo subsp. pepo]|uniref:uncharacterized protein LOC111791698 n=1 Tax=Cucurbita pepo subsp. pepo TaxID=3664 RepID=UPI000C9D485A|nr:uncharacterized protein LOC111791698 [Cucurbita pepo subsp. pepo]
MSRRALDSRESIHSCTLKLHGWRPFQLPKALDSDAHTSAPTSAKPYYSSSGLHTKRPCLSDRTTSFNIDAIDMSGLSLIDDDKPSITAGGSYSRPSFQLIARKRRRRRGSRSVSGRSTDRSGTRRCCSVGASAAHGTCSDFPMAVGTDSSGELFVNGDANWSSDVSEAKNSRRREREEKDQLGSGFGSSNGGFDAQGNESGYGSEPGYRGDGEFGYGDEIDEEDEDARLLLWGERLGDSRVEIVGENTFTDQKSHHRCRRKKHECGMVDSLR